MSASVYFPTLDSDIVYLNPADFAFEFPVHVGENSIVYKGRRLRDGFKCAFKFYGYRSKVDDVGRIFDEVNALNAMIGIRGVVTLYGIFLDIPTGYLTRKTCDLPLPGLKKS
jgi:hypothetical protein